MADTALPTPPPAETPAAPGRSKDDVALELMKFIAVATGYGRNSQSSTGFSAKQSSRSPEEQAESLIELFERCRKAVDK